MVQHHYLLDNNVCRCHNPDVTDSFITVGKRMRKSDSLVITYIYLAIASLIFGVIILFGVLAVCRYFDIDLWLNW